MLDLNAEETHIRHHHVADDEIRFRDTDHFVRLEPVPGLNNGAERCKDGPHVPD
jgi:hypothetical protein